MRGVQRSGLTAAAPVPGAGASGDTSGLCHNCAAIAASSLRPQTRPPLVQTKAATGGTRESTHRTLVHSPGWRTHLGRPHASPSGVSEASIPGLIVKTSGSGRKNQAKNTGRVREGIRVNVSLQSLRRPASIPPSLTPPPNVTQVNLRGD